MTSTSGYHVLFLQLLSLRCKGKQQRRCGYHVLFVQLLSLRCKGQQQRRCGCIVCPVAVTALQRSGAEVDGRPPAGSRLMKRPMRSA